jgi:hypothetical protein
MISNIVSPTVERFGSFTESKFGISSSEDLVYIFDILRSKLYSNKIAAVVREYSTNAADANVENGLRDKPIVITAPTRMVPQFKVRDFGRGLTEEEIRNVYCMYGRSTKRNSNDYTGQLGLGSKSGFAYGDSFTIVSYKDGVKHTYTAYIDETRLGSIAKVDESKTQEENGIEIVIPVNISDIRSFESEIATAVKYFKVKPNVLNISAISFQSDEKEIISGKGWKVYANGVNSYYQSKAVAVMGNIGYPINVQTLTNNTYSVNALNSPICIDFDIGKLSISANREELEYNESTKKAILDRVKEIEAEIIDVTEKQLKDCKNIIEAKKKFGSFNRHFSWIINGKVKWNGITITSSSLDVNTTFCTARLYNPNGKSEVVHHIFLGDNHRNVEEIFYHDGQRGNYAKVAHLAKTNNYFYCLIQFHDRTNEDGGTTSPDAWIKANGLDRNLFRNASVLADPPKSVRVPRVKGQSYCNCYFINDEKSLKSWGTASENYSNGKCDKKAGGLYIKVDHFLVMVNGSRTSAKDFIRIVKIFNEITGDSIDPNKIPCFRASEAESLSDKWTDINSYMIEKLNSCSTIVKYSNLQSYSDIFESIDGYYGIGIFNKSLLNAISARSSEFTDNTRVSNLIRLWENIKAFMEENRKQMKGGMYDKIKDIGRYFTINADTNNKNEPEQLREEIQNMETEYPLLAIINRSSNNNTELNKHIVNYIAKL